MTKPGPRLPVLPSHEQETVKAIMQLLKFHHIPAWRMNTGATKVADRFIRFGVVGMSDIIGIVSCTSHSAAYECPRGKFLAIEVKAANGGIVTIAQQAFLKAVNDAGGLGFVARSVDEVRKALGLP